MTMTDNAPVRCAPVNMISPQEENFDERGATSDYYENVIDLLTFTNENGINVQTKGISRVTKQLKFYLNEANAFALKQNFRGSIVVQLANGALLAA